MNKGLSRMWGLVAHYKYLITVVLGVAMVGFIDDNSFVQRVKYDLQISQLKDEISKYRQQNERSTRALRELESNPRAIEKVARERYFMKADDEDVFILSSDKRATSPVDNLNEEGNEATQ